MNQIHSVGRVRIDPGGVAVRRLFPGTALGARGPVGSAIPRTVQLWSLEPGADVQLPLPAGWRGFVYVFEGAVEIGNDSPLGAGQMSPLDPEGEVRLRRRESPGS